MTKSELLAIAQPVALKFWRRLRKHYPQLPNDCPNVRICGRLRTTLAYGIVDNWEIQLSQKFMSCNVDLFVTDIIGHELAHIADDCINGTITNPKEFHADNWRIIMHKLNLAAVEQYTVEWPNSASECN